LTSRPNILFIFTDQQFAGAMSCAGNGDLHTPAMDSLAETGVRFDRAYCTQPLCTPSRASMMTGLYPFQTGAPRNGMGIDESLRSREMGAIFSAAGYECVYGGKWHIPEIAIPEGHGFRQIAGFGDPKLTDACVEFLRSKQDGPFLLVASFDNPHNICEWTREQRLPWGPIGEPPPVRKCPNLPVNFAVPAFEPQFIRYEQRAWPTVYSAADFAEEDWRRYRWAYYRLVEKVDAQIGQVLDALKAAGLENDTLVVFSSDHGDGHGAHHWSQKSVLYEESIRIPLIVNLPDATQAARVDREHLVSNGLDLLPTLCDYAGVEPPKGLPGASLRPLLEGASAAGWRDELAVTTTFDGDKGYVTQGRTLHTGRYKYVLYDRGRYREQLFDMPNDPGEMVNLAVEARYADVLDEHRRRLIDWMRESQDPYARQRSRMPPEVSG